MSASKGIMTLRQMEWEQIKGKLHALLHTFWGTNKAEEEQFREAVKFVKDFIKRGNNIIG